MKELSIENQLGLMEKYNLSAEEMFITDLLFLSSPEEGHSEYLHSYLNFSNVDLREILVSLQNKQVIIKSYKIPAKGQVFDPETVEFNKNFLNNYKKYSGILGYEFFCEYPSYGLINGSEVPLRNYAKKFNSEEDFFFAYGRSIGWNKEKHEHVLGLIRWAKENNCRLLNMNIADFVISKTWLSIEDIRNGEGAMAFDNISLI